ncbi:MULTISPECIES: hypothetical protein [Prauserella]|uniref:Uncharacterized protein n=1 Tax=Prauserella endophytica TaxID=1592324 RepID=A0ABY2RTC7_9PSEU|nr:MULTISPECIES: hypothetical protein [Prauserella]TKG59885.1 hypothetical protein FCN18_36270 [Prauserella endophytica]
MTTQTDYPQTAKNYGVLDRPSSVPTMHKETLRMLLHEELARARIRDMHRAIDGPRHDLRLARAARRWNRVARWAARRSRRYSR